MEPTDCQQDPGRGRDDERRDEGSDVPHAGEPSDGDGGDQAIYAKPKNCPMGPRRVDNGRPAAPRSAAHACGWMS
ncbi:hypothetical protein GCM10010170_029670 [Dactylosporangium salmoneum]|uniref:Uncharacterized protein n=1 Tax=Dactylosporangium salmoneum TaxID=53361 RepID=A0ABN3G628_9ACTN